MGNNPETSRKMEQFLVTDSQAKTLLNPAQNFNSKICNPANTDIHNAVAKFNLLPFLSTTSNLTKRSGERDWKETNF